MVSEKLYEDIPHLLNDDHLLSHTIDEALLFDKELQSLNYSGMDNQPGCLTVLTAEDVCFKRWLSMEKKCKYKASFFLCNYFGRLVFFFNCS